jgi:YfiH family protein
VIEQPVEGIVPRRELLEWRRDYGVVAGVTGQAGAGRPFDLGLAGTAPIGEVLDRWAALREAVPGFQGVVVSRQVHGTEILWHGPLAGTVIHEAADGHATGSAGVLLAVTAADCIPVYLLDPVTRSIALLHAGWKGTAGGILGQGIALLAARGSLVENLLVHCGVGICGACYEVGAEVFAGCGVAAPPGGKGPLDLREILLEQARSAGVEKVSTSEWCSRHDPGFFSHRGGQDGRMAAYLGLL